MLEGVCLSVCAILVRECMNEGTKRYDLLLLQDNVRLREREGQRERKKKRDRMMISNECGMSFSIYG